MEISLAAASEWGATAFGGVPQKAGKIEEAYYRILTKFSQVYAIRQWRRDVRRQTQILPHFGKILNRFLNQQHSHATAYGSTAKKYGA